MHNQHLPAHKSLIINQRHWILPFDFMIYEAFNHRQEEDGKENCEQENLLKIYVLSCFGSRRKAPFKWLAVRGKRDLLIIVYPFRVQSRNELVRKYSLDIIEDKSIFTNQFKSKFDKIEIFFQQQFPFSKESLLTSDDVPISVSLEPSPKNVTKK